MNNTIWLDGMIFDNVEKITKDKTVDVLIIGGGITGLSTAYHLLDSKLNVCLVERNLIAHGISSRTTGKLTYLQDNIYTKLDDSARIYYKSQKYAIKIVKKIVKKNNINCDLEKVDSYIYINKLGEMDIIKKEEAKLKELGIKYEECDKLPIKIKCRYAIKVKDTFVFHPVKYLKTLKKIIVDKGIKVYENSCVTDIKKDNQKYICTVNNKKIIADKVVVASHYPFFLKPYFIPLKTYLEKSYISASLSTHNTFSSITLSTPIKSIRYQNDYLIYLTGTHNMCTKYNNKDNFKELKKDLNNLKLKPKYMWSNYDIMTEDNLPYIGFIDNNLLIGTGYNTWGMTNGSIAGVILSDLILGRENKYKELFDPKRNKGINLFKYPLYMSYSAKTFIENKINKNKSWYKDKVKFTKINGKNVGVYKDKFNKEHIVYNLCPHLKCSLIFNEEEKTWDCPCHGSRFDIDGKCIVGPSKYNITYKDK